MSSTFHPLAITDVARVPPARHHDARGSFSETYRPPPSHGKLVRVLRGHVVDVCVDLRRDSPDFGRWVGSERDRSAPFLEAADPASRCER